MRKHSNMNVQLKCHPGGNIWNNDSETKVFGISQFWVLKSALLFQPVTTVYISCTQVLCWHVSLLTYMYVFWCSHVTVPQQN